MKAIGVILMRIRWGRTVQGRNRKNSMGEEERWRTSPITVFVSDGPTSTLYPRKFSLHCPFTDFRWSHPKRDSPPPRARLEVIPHPTGVEERIAFGSPIGLVKLRQLSSAADVEIEVAALIVWMGLLLAPGRRTARRGQAENPKLSAGPPQAMFGGERIVVRKQSAVIPCVDTLGVVEKMMHAVVEIPSHQPCRPSRLQLSDLRPLSWTHTVFFSPPPRVSERIKLPGDAIAAGWPL